MNILDIARQDIRDISSDANAFAVSADWLAPTGQMLTANVLHTKHHKTFNVIKGEYENGKNAHVSIAEALFVEGNYPCRNSAGEVHLEKHQVRVPDSTGTVCHYRIMSWYPSETVGLIVCILSDLDDAEARTFDDTFDNTL